MNSKSVLIYGRFSTDRQEDGDSKRRQIESASAWAKAHGYTVRQIFFDEGVCADKGKNWDKQFSQLLKELKDGESILVEDIDRISRQHPWLANGKLYELITSGHNIITWRNDVTFTEKNIEDLNIFLVADVQSALARQENVKKRFRQNERWIGWIKDIEAGKKVKCQKVPGWLQFKDGAFNVKDGAKETVERIFNLSMQGVGSILIAKQLFAEKVPVLASNKRSKWNDTYIRGLLSDKSVIGTLTLKGKEYKGYYPPVVSEELFYSVQSRNRKSPHLGGRPAKESINLFTHLLKCSHCGQSFVLAGGHAGKPNLVCNNARLGQGCKFHVFPYQYLEQSFITLFDNYNFAMLFSNKTKEDLVTEDILNAKIAETDKQIVKLTGLIMDDATPSKALVAKLKEMEHQREKLSEDLKQLEIDTKASAVDLDAFEDIQEEIATKWNQPDFRLKLRAFYATVVAKIVIDAKQRTYTVHFNNSEKTVNVKILNKDDMIMDGKQGVYSFDD